MARYIAAHNIPPDGGALAFAAGHQVPASHVERYGWLETGWVVEVDDEHVGDALDLAQPPPDTTPPTVTPAQRLLAEQFDDEPDGLDGGVENFAPFATGGVIPSLPFGEDNPPGLVVPTKPRKAQPATGDTTTDQPATEE